MNSQDIDHQIQGLLSQKPQRFQIQFNNQNTAKLQWRWFKNYDIIGLLICLPLLLGIYFLKEVHLGSFLVFYFFLIIFALALAFVTYTFLCGLINKTQIIISKKTIKIKHGPLPLKLNQNIPLLKIQNFQIEDSHNYSKSAQTGKVEKTNKTHSALFGVFENGNKKQIADSRISHEIDFLKNFLELIQKKYKVFPSSEVTHET